MLMEHRILFALARTRRPRSGAAVLLALALLAGGCSPGHRVSRYLDRQLGPPHEPMQYTGTLLVDANDGRTLYGLNAQKAFTPASNTKLFTLYAALKALPERIPALKYHVRGDTLYVVATGDPSALHPDLADSTALKFMGGFPAVALVNDNLADPALGPGWAWDDYDQYYSPGRTAMPIHGNILRLREDAGLLQAEPAAFRDSLRPGEYPFARAQHNNIFYRLPAPGDTLDIPLHTSPGLERQLWAAALGRPLAKAHPPFSGALTVLPGIATDTLLRKMMTESDNFIAEQLMLLVSSTLGDTLSFERARDHVLKHWLADLPQPPRWVDGSGLSRYNQVSPASVVYLLQRMHAEIPEARLFALMAQGGRPGTLRTGFRDPAGPYLFGKTGSMGGVQNLSGYLKTRSGKTVVFSFMNNHFTGPGRLVRARMERILEWVRENY